MLCIRSHDDSDSTALWALGIDVRGPYGDLLGLPLHTDSPILMGRRQTSRRRISEARSIDGIDAAADTQHTYSNGGITD